MKNSATQTVLRGLCAAAGAVLTLGTLLLAALLLPAQRDVAAAQDAALGYRGTQAVETLLSDALSGYLTIPKHYSIPTGARPAPPREENYGATADAGEIRNVINGASALLDGEEIVAWTEETQLYKNTELTYYRDETILALCWQEVWKGRICTFLEVKMADASQLRRKLAGDTYGYAMQFPASELAAQDNAVAAVNADFYAFRTNGIRVYQGRIYLMNGADSDMAFFTRSGDMLLVHRGDLTREAEIRAFVEENDIDFSLAFGPILAENGVITVPAEYPRGELESWHSRTAISQLGTLHYLCVTINGEDDYHYATARDTAQIMLNHGCLDVYNLDGGQTAVMIMHDQLMNRVDFGFERTMSDVLCFASALPKEAAP